jgi:hypothetical protein
MTTAPECTCGYQAASDDDLADHLGELLIPGNDEDASGQVHAEAARDGKLPVGQPQAACLCGFAAASPAGLDAHLLAAFSAPGSPPGVVHQPRTGP